MGHVLMWPRSLIRRLNCIIVIDLKTSRINFCSAIKCVNCLIQLFFFKLNKLIVACDTF